jgi:hypothetical protein
MNDALTPLREWPVRKSPNRRNRTDPAREQRLDS